MYNNQIIDWAILYVKRSRLRSSIIDIAPVKLHELYELHVDANTTSIAFP